MKFKLIALTIAGLAAAPAFAQSSVTVFGVLDMGYTYTDDAGRDGNSMSQIEGGVNRVNKLGFMGTEDLGNGRKATFLLEQGLSLDTGEGPRGYTWLQSYVGLGDAKLGQINAGRIYDFTYNLIPYLACSNCGLFAVQNADLDRVSGNRFNNAVQYRSPRIAGFSFGAMYAQDERALPTQLAVPQRGTSFMVDYWNGPFKALLVNSNLRDVFIPASVVGTETLLGARTGLHDARPPLFKLDEQNIYGVGLAYTIGSVTPKLLYTETHMQLGGEKANNRNLNVGAEWQLTPAVVLSAKYAHDRLEGSKWDSISLGADYALSKRTILYIETTQQKADGDGTVASIGKAPAPASDDRQGVYRVGVRHSF
jgi:outer membrane protein OmpU